jgi:hypothetical protein
MMPGTIYIIISNDSNHFARVYIGFRLYEPANENLAGTAVSICPPSSS